MSEALVGAIVDTRYELRRLIARGGMGLVFEAHHKFTRRTVALKLLPESLRGMSEAHGRQLREAHALTAVRHPGFVEVLDAGVCRSHGPYVVLEMLEGRALEGILAARGRLSVQDTVQLGRQVCDAVAHAHLRGVIHRDVKPSNIFVARDEVGEEAVKIIDFGVAALEGGHLAEHDRKLTTAHEVIGTPEYMAFEQLLGQDIDARTDVYAVGVVLFECLTGEVPYAGSYPEVLVRVSNATTAPDVRAKRADVPATVARAIERALEKEASARFRTAADLGRALVEGGGYPPRRTWLLSPPPEDRAASANPREHESERAIKLVRKKTRLGEGDGQALPVQVPAAAGDASARRRQFVRAPYVTPVVVEIPGVGPIDARSEEISEEGMLVVLPVALDPDTAIEARFACPTSGAMVVVSGRVRWTREARGRTAVGVEFVRAPPELRGNIARYIATLPAAS